MPDSTTLLVELAVVTAKVTLLSIGGAVGSLALRRSSAACRHALWTAVLGGALFIAASAPFSATWSLPVGVTIETTALGGRPTAVETSRSSSSPASRAVPVDHSSPGASHEALLPEEPSRHRLADALVTLWLAGICVLILRVVAGHVALLRLAARARTLDPRRDLAVPDDVRARLIVTDELSMPAAWGVVRPVIALPAGAVAWPPSRIADALRHECAHVRRRDPLTRLGAELCCALLWFHPGVWFAARRMRAECERACDDVVLAAGGVGLAYAQLLLELATTASRAGRDLARSASAMAGTHELERRMRAILDPATVRSSSPFLLACVLAIATFTTVTTAAVRVRTDEQSSRAEKSRATDDDRLDERVPLTTEQEQRAIRRRFRPRDEREARAFAALKNAAKHEKQHAMDLVRERATWALHIAEPDRVIGPLVGELANPDWRIRAYAAWNLRLLHVPEARSSLTALLGDPIWRVRAGAADAIAELAEAASIEDMLPLLSDPAWQVRVAVVEFLGRVATPRALSALRDCTSDPHVAVRVAVDAALADTRIR